MATVRNTPCGKLSQKSEKDCIAQRVAYTLQNGHVAFFYFRHFLCEKIGDFLENQCYDHFLAIKPIFSPIFSAKIPSLQVISYIDP
jgi:hypothetical protein